MTALLDARARHWSVAMTERPSVTGTPDEAAFGPWLAEALRAAMTLGPQARIWTFPVAPGDARHCVAVLVRGAGRRTVLLTGHYDTVSVADYAEHAPLATQPDRLLGALRERLDARAETPAERRARADLATGRYLPGRGLLDMKAGLGAGLAVMEAFAADAGARGNLLFIAVPDEENASAGARAAAARLEAIAAEEGIAVEAVVNLDSIADDGDGSEGRIVALGTVGKVLPTAFVVGTPVHSGFPLRGMNAAVLAGIVAARVEWAAELTDGPAGTPPSLLSLTDGRTGYDVTTPATAWAYWSVLNRHRDPAAVLAAFEGLCRTALREGLAALAARGGIAAPEVPVVRFADLWAGALAAGGGTALRMMAEDLAGMDLSIPDQCRRLTAATWAASGRAGPAVVVGFGSVPYPATHLSEGPLHDAVRALVAEAPARHGVTIAAADFFAGISDMSFFGGSDPEAMTPVAANTPAWASAIAPGGDRVAGLPTVNLGPWGRDYHTPLERLETDYAFRVLPRLLQDLIGRVLADA